MTTPEPPQPGHETKGVHEHATRRFALLVALNWARFIMMFFIGLALTPMLITSFGMTVFGLFMTLFLARPPFQDVFVPVLTRELSAAWASGDPQRKRWAFTGGTVMSFIAAAVALVGVALLVPVNAFLSNVPPDDAWKVKVAIISEGGMLVAMLAGGSWINMFLADHRLVENAIHRMFERFQDLVVAVVAFFMLNLTIDQKYLAFTLGRLAVRCLHILFIVWRVRRIEPDARIVPALVDRAGLRTFFAAGGWSTSIPISNQVFFLADQFLLNIFLGPLYNGMYSVINQLRGYARILGGGALGSEAMTADLHERGHHEAVRKLLINSMKWTTVVTSLCTVLVGVFAGPLMHAWLGKAFATEPTATQLAAAGLSTDHAIHICWVFCLIMFPGVIIMEAGCAATFILYGMGHIARYAPGLLISTALKIIAVFMALKLTSDINSVAWVTSISMILIYGVWLPLLIKKLTGVSVREQLMQTYARPIAAVLPVLALGLLLSFGLAPWGAGLLALIKVAACMGVLTLVYVPIAMWIVPTPDQRPRVFGAASRLLGKIPGMRSIATRVAAAGEVRA